MKVQRLRVLPPWQLVALLVSALMLPLASADDWVTVTSKDNKVSVLFPEDIKKNQQTQVERTIAGRVTTYFGESHGDGIILAGSGADLPKLARGRDNSIYSTTKKGFLKEAKGTEVSFKETKVDGVAARELIYKGKAYRGKGGAYTGRAVMFIVNNRVYIVNSVITKSTPANSAATKKMFDSVKVAK